ncbi:hypothetical protein MtrunA17_Chr8g0375281 [Medicago truncatula]|uniref:Transmembrane protein n=1 Tax=Medicago truncatula TaxID=3880 RepID=A0A396GQ46_MEDTR|nr:hypothetical protein MtrunA17_Chr8g0375281 [Medicago truncatula]
MASLSACRTMTEVLVDFLIITSFASSSWLLFLLFLSSSWSSSPSILGGSSKLDKIFFFFFFLADVVFPGYTNRFFLFILSSSFCGCSSSGSERYVLIEIRVKFVSDFSFFLVVIVFVFFFESILTPEQFILLNFVVEKLGKTFTSCRSRCTIQE